MKTTGPMKPEGIAEFLAEVTVPLRLAVLDDKGSPLVVSLWYAFSDGALWCATPRSATIARHLQHDPRCAFEIAPETPPYRGVRGQGRAELHRDDGERVLRSLLERYQQMDTRLGRWLLDRVADEVAIRIVPNHMSSWDFTQRMQG